MEKMEVMMTEAVTVGSGSEDHGAAMEVMKELDSMEVKLEVMITVLEEVIVKVIVHWWWKCESGVEVENQ